jgi:hypothetical protein
MPAAPLGTGVIPECKTKTSRSGRCESVGDDSNTAIVGRNLDVYNYTRPLLLNGVSELFFESNR